MKRTAVPASSAATVAGLAAVAIGAVGNGATADAVEYPFRVTCGFLPFKVEALDKPRGLEQRDTPLGRAVRRIVTGFGPELPIKNGWRVLARTPKNADLGAGDPPRMANLVVTKREGAWEFRGSSDRCRPTAVSKKGDAATWRVDPDDLPLAPDATGFTALVSSPQCSGGEPPTDRVSDPVVSYGGDEIGVTFFVRPLDGIFTCEGSPPAEVEVQLAEPIGGRDLLNLGHYPPGEIRTVR